MFRLQSLYPVNALRNVALENVRTEFAFLSDADFLPGGANDVHAAFSRAAGQLLASDDKASKKVYFIYF